MLRLIESLTVEEGASDDTSGGASAEDMAEAAALAADIMNLPLGENALGSQARATGSSSEDGRA